MKKRGSSKSKRSGNHPKKNAPTPPPGGPSRLAFTPGAGKVLAASPGDGPSPFRDVRSRKAISPATSVEVQKESLANIEPKIDSHRDMDDKALTRVQRTLSFEQPPPAMPWLDNTKATRQRNAEHAKLARSNRDKKSWMISSKAGALEKEALVAQQQKLGAAEAQLEAIQNRLRELEQATDAPDFDHVLNQSNEEIVQERARKQRERELSIKRQQAESLESERRLEELKTQRLQEIEEMQRRSSALDELQRTSSQPRQPFVMPMMPSEESPEDRLQGLEAILNTLENTITEEDGEHTPTDGRFAAEMLPPTPNGDPTRRLGRLDRMLGDLEAGLEGVESDAEASISISEAPSEALTEQARMDQMERRLMAMSGRLDDLDHADARLQLQEARRLHEEARQQQQQRRELAARLLQELAAASKAVNDPHNLDQLQRLVSAVHQAQAGVLSRDNNKEAMGEISQARQTAATHCAGLARELHARYLQQQARVADPSLSRAQRAAEEQALPPLRDEALSACMAAVACNEDQKRGIETELGHRISARRRAAWMTRLDDQITELGALADLGLALARTCMQQPATKAPAAFQLGQLSRAAVEAAARTMASEEAGEAAAAEAGEAKAMTLQALRNQLGELASESGRLKMQAGPRWRSNTATAPGLGGALPSERFMQRALFARAAEDQELVCGEGRLHARETRQHDDLLDFSVPAVLGEWRAVEKMSHTYRLTRGMGSEEEEQLRREGLQNAVLRCENLSEEVIGLKREELQDAESCVDKEATAIARRGLGEVLLIAMRCKQRQLQEVQQQVDENEGSPDGVGPELRTELARGAEAVQQASLETLVCKRWHESHLKKMLRRAPEEDVAYLEYEEERLHAQLGEISLVAAQQLEARLRALRQALKGDLTKAELSKLQNEFKRKRAEHRSLNSDALAWLVQTTQEEVHSVEERLMSGVGELDVVESKVLQVEERLAQQFLKELCGLHSYWKDGSGQEDELKLSQQRALLRKSRRLQVQKEQLVARMRRGALAACSAAQQGELQRHWTLLEAHRVDTARNRQEKEEAEVAVAEIRWKIQQTEQELARTAQRAQKAVEERKSSLARVQRDHQLEAEAMAVACALGQSEEEVMAIRRFEQRRQADWRDQSRLYALATREHKEGREEMNWYRKLQRLKDREQEVKGLRLASAGEVERKADQAQAAQWQAEVEQWTEEGMLQALREYCHEDIAHAEKAEVERRQAEVVRLQRQCWKDELERLQRGTRVWRVPASSFRRAHNSTLRLEVRDSDKAYLLRWDSRHKKQPVVPLVRQSKLVPGRGGGAFKRRWSSRGLPVHVRDFGFTLESPGKELSVCAETEADHEVWTRVLKVLLHQE